MSVLRGVSSRSPQLDIPVRNVNCVGTPQRPWLRRFTLSFPLFASLFFVWAWKCHKLRRAFSVVRCLLSVATWSTLHSCHSGGITRLKPELRVIRQLVITVTFSPPQICRIRSENWIYLCIFQTFRRYERDFSSSSTAVFYCHLLTLETNYLLFSTMERHEYHSILFKIICIRPIPSLQTNQV
jgi:hypothetical protein